MRKFLLLCIVGLALWYLGGPELRSMGYGWVSDISGTWHDRREGGFQAKVIGISDGDTLSVVDGNRQTIKVRLEGIDAPELMQPFGAESKYTLTLLVAGKEVVIVPKGEDQYERLLGRVYIGEMDVNKEMVNRGLAWHFLRYSKEIALITAQVSARSAGRGLWAQEGPVEPWEWRRSGR